MSAMTHNELAADLAAHLAGNTRRMVWLDTQLGPSGSKRPDVFTLTKSYVDFDPTIYEVKVSVADLRSDVTAGKYQAYFKFAHAVWFALPAGMAAPADIPRECGIITRGDKGWRAVRRPVPQRLDTLPRDAWMKLLIDGVTRERTGPKVRERVISSWSLERTHRKQLGEDVCEAVKSLEGARARAEQMRLRADAELKDAREEIRRQGEEAEPRLVELRALRAELCDLLGIKHDRRGDPADDAFEIKRALRELRSPVSQLAENLRWSLDNLRRALDAAVEADRALDGE